MLHFIVLKAWGKSVEIWKSNKKDLPLLRKIRDNLIIMTNNADFWTSVAHIIEEGFTTDGLQQLDRYAELFISEKLVYKRFSPLE